MTQSRRTSKPKAPETPKEADQDGLHFLTTGARAPKKQSGALYSRFVRAMKLTLPLGAVILLGAILLWPQLRGESNRFEVGISGIDPRHPNRLKVVNARYRGVDGQGQPYSVIAESAYEADEGSKTITLEAPSADMMQKDGAWVLSNAPEGSYDRTNEILKLWGGVTIFHDKGYTFSSPTAQIQLKDGYAAGDDPASAYGPGGEIEGQDGFEIRDKGSRILFKGKSRLILQPGGSFDVSGS